MGAITAFMDEQFKHFNARETRSAARGWIDLLDQGGEMFVTLAGAMSSAELGISLARMIRANKIHGICCTAANLEEDLFNLFAQSDYELVPNYREFGPQDEVRLRERGLNRVTDTCIPETAMRDTERIFVRLWKEAAGAGTSRFPWEYVYEVLDDPAVGGFDVPAENSWVLAAKERNLPIYTPGFEDSTLGNIFCARVMQGVVGSHQAVRTGTEQMQHLADFYRKRAAAGTPLGFFQIGGGIAGDFPICVVPMLIQDLKEDVPYWAYFCQIGDSVTSYGSYSGAVPGEKITWCKLDVDTPKYMINSDATVVAPLIFAYVLGD